MKRSMLLILAGFGLASMLFALVAFVGAEAENGKGIVFMRVMDSTEKNSYGRAIVIAYPDGKTERIEMDGNILYRTENEKIMPNTSLINSTLNKIQSEGYNLRSHSSSIGDGMDYETYIFEKNSCTTRPHLILTRMKRTARFKLAPALTTPNPSLALCAKRLGKGGEL